MKCLKRKNGDLVIQITFKKSQITCQKKDAGKEKEVKYK